MDIAPTYPIEITRVVTHLLSGMSHQVVGGHLGTHFRDPEAPVIYTCSFLMIRYSGKKKQNGEKPWGFSLDFLKKNHPIDRWIVFLTFYGKPVDFSHCSFLKITRKTNKVPFKQYHPIPFRVMMTQKDGNANHQGLKLVNVYFLGRVPFRLDWK